MSTLAKEDATLDVTACGVTTEWDVEVLGNYHKSYRGSREPGGLQIEPDEPAHFEIMWVYLVGKDGKSKTDITDLLTEAQRDAIAESIMSDNVPEPA